MRLLLSILALAWPLNALHFYMESNERKCFMEELPQHTLVVGKYRAEDYSGTTYFLNPQLGIQVLVDEVASGHNVVSSRGPAEGKFTFTAHDAGEHSICLSTNYTAGWLGEQKHVKMFLDIAIGGVKRDAVDDEGHVQDLADKLNGLDNQLSDIRREQRFQREREADFRDLSEKTNARAVHWSIVQIILLLFTCWYQLRHLKSFFSDKKVR